MSTRLGALEEKADCCCQQHLLPALPASPSCLLHPAPRIVLWEVLTLQLPYASGTQGPWQVRSCFIQALQLLFHGVRPQLGQQQQLHCALAQLP